jgi:hypothetical protein
MFRALTCPSSGGQIVLSQHLLSSLSVNGCTESDDTRCCDNIICPPEDGHVNARNMSLIVSHSVILRMRDVSHKFVDKMKRHFMFNIY